MSFLNTDKLRAEIEKGKLIDPYDSQRIKQGAYELSAAREYYHTAMDKGKELVKANEHLSIAPGTLGILITHETVTIPADRIGFISIKFSVKIKGLINVSGFHVDPGFRGKLKFSVYNPGDRAIIIEPEQPLFTLWLSELSGREDKDDLYNGKHKDQKSILPSDVEAVRGYVASPGALLREIESIKSELHQHRVAGAFMIAVMLAAIIVPAYEWAVDYWKAWRPSSEPGVVQIESSDSAPPETEGGTDDGQ